jgi:hypothetical protein
MRAFAVTLSTLTLVAGCSFIAVRGPDTSKPDSTCTTSRLAPAGDTILAVASLATLTLGIVGATVIDPGDPGSKTIVKVSALPILVFSVSAVHGFDLTAKCRRYNAETRAD